MRPTGQERTVIEKGLLVPKQRGTPPPTQAHVRATRLVRRQKSQRRVGARAASVVPSGRNR